MFGSSIRCGRVVAVAAALIAINVPVSSFSQPVQRLNGSAQLHYADIVDLFGSAPVVVRARIAKATRLIENVRSTEIARFFVEADVISLIRGAGGVPPRISYVVDVAAESSGKFPKLKKADVLLAAIPVAGRPGEIQLAARDGQKLWSAPLEAQIRSAIAAVVARDAAPIVTGVGSAFHVAGSIPGEGETQLFLTTATGAPISLSILRRPGEQPRWAMALGEIVDEAAGPPAKDSLAWYRLACFLPPTLPDAATRELAPADASIAREDYIFVIAQLGVCERARSPGNGR
jgi:hypothetical protein